MADDKKAGSKKKFISDQDMWELSLDMVGDDSIDSDNRSRDKQVAPKGNKPQSKSKPTDVTKTSRARTTTLPKSGQKSQVKQSSPKPAAVKQKNPAVSQASKPASQAKRKPKVQSTPVQQQTSARVNQARPQSATNKTQATTNTNRRVVSNSQKTSTQERSKQSVDSRYKEAHSRPATFTVRDTGGRVALQNHDEIKKIKRKEKFLKVAAMAWSLFEGAGVLLLNAVKFTVGSLPFVFHHKLMISVALISFGLGFIVASIGGPTTAPSADTASSSKLSSSSKNKITKPKTKKSKSKKKQTKARINTKQKAVTPQVNTVHDKSPANNQFSGRDVLFEEVDVNAMDNAENEAVVEGSSFAESTDTQSLIAPDLQSTEAEIQAEIDMLIEDQVNEDLAGVENTEKTLSVEGQSSDLNKDSENLMQLLERNFKLYKNKQWQEVINNSTEILKIDPSIINAYINRSIAYTELGNIDQAISDANKAILLDPQNPLAINNRGYAYEKSGVINNAIADYQAACSLGISVSCNEVRRLRNDEDSAE